ncbi:hypothetical protein XHC_1427 [Xanthomonas hortorum pv. carotae str. M081]|nr:hypothetical protein XHC_1427 [Xanthomonas hortorum pv. carotae str. M081]
MLSPDPHRLQIADIRKVVTYRVHGDSRLMWLNWIHRGLPESCNGKIARGRCAAPCAK